MSETYLCLVLERRASGRAAGGRAGERAGRRAKGWRGCAVWPVSGSPDCSRKLATVIAIRLAYRLSSIHAASRFGRTSPVWPLRTLLAVLSFTGSPSRHTLLGCPHFYQISSRRPALPAIPFLPASSLVPHYPAVFISTSSRLAAQHYRLSLFYQLHVSYDTTRLSSFVSAFRLVRRYPTVLTSTSSHLAQHHRLPPPPITVYHLVPHYRLSSQVTSTSYLSCFTIPGCSHFYPVWQLSVSSHTTGSPHFYQLSIPSSTTGCCRSTRSPSRPALKLPPFCQLPSLISPSAFLSYTSSSTRLTLPVVLPSTSSPSRPALPAVCLPFH